jgi:putative ubiquitin-RnfH superfamily antitoxin RatB of RatAB toxin-antitoxin module
MPDPVPDGVALAAAAPRKRCLVACDGSQGVVCVEVELEPGATIEDALLAARVLLPQVEADWQSGATGIWGVIRPRNFCPVEGDRVELYRPLPQDPRTRRRERVQRVRQARR